MSSWDVFHGETLELERDLSTLQVQAALAAGDLRPDDLARPAGSKEAWLPIGQLEGLRLPSRPTKAAPAPPKSTQPPPPPARPEPSPESLAKTVPLPDFFELAPDDEDDVSFPVVPGTSASSDAPQPSVEPPPVVPEKARMPEPAPSGWGWQIDDDEEEDEVVVVEWTKKTPPPHVPDVSTPADPASQWELGEFDINPQMEVERSADPEGPSSKVALPVVSERSSQIALPVVASRDWSEPSLVEGGEDEEEETFTFARRATNKVEELDLAPMVDVAFQLVLFFMVTATTVLYKTLEVPKPSPDSPPSAVAQGRSKTIDDLRDDFIIVEIDQAGTFKIDREPVAADMETLIRSLRSARDKTARLTMLLSADYSTPHRFAVLAIDAANEIGLRIAVARPQGKQAQAAAPSLFPLNPKGAAPKADAAGKAG